MAGTMIMQALGKAGMVEANGYLIITSDTDQRWAIATEEPGGCGKAPMAAIRCDEIASIELVDGDVWSVRISLATGRSYSYDCEDKSTAEGLVLEAIDAITGS